MDIDMMSIGKRIKDRRKELKLTQTDIKRECGMSEGDQDEIMEILNMKLRKAQRARRTSAKSSGLTDTGEANMVG